MKRALLSLALLPVLACTEAPQPPNQPLSNPTPQTKTDSAPMPDASKSPSEQNNAFALDLYQQLRKEKTGNLFFSPTSISVALAMTYAGAKGETAEEMAKVLHFALPPEELHPAFGALLQQWNTPGKGYQLSVANRLWGATGYKFLDEFLQITKTSYNAPLEQLDFAGKTEEARQIINKWAEDATQQKIKDLLPKGVLDPLTRLVLTNAIYFKGNWASQFKKEQTQERPFYLGAENNWLKVPMMTQKGTFSYAELEDAKMLELPYVGEDLSMLILLPNELNGLAALEEKLSKENLSAWSASLAKKKDVVVSIPKFQVESSFSLKETLQAMGMKAAFGEASDFSGMNGKKDLYISAVLHKAFVEVNEEGTEAAAATAVVINERAMRPATEFKADHPFVFLIRDNRSGDTLFMGRFVKP